MTQPTEKELESTQAAKLLQNCLTGNWMTQVIYVAAELRLADLLAERPRTSAELAALTGTHEPSLRRLLRALIDIGVCGAGRSGSFELAPMGELIRADSPDSLRSWTLWCGRSLSPAWGNLLHSVRTGESARAMLTGTQGFDHLAQDVEAAAVFYQATVELSRLVAPAILSAYDFSGLARIVDVGGGYGELLVWILRANPSAIGVLFELRQALAGARRHLEEGGVGHRCELVEGDFFMEVPRGADAYLLSSVLHNWSDECAARILATCRRSMGEDARLVLIEEMLPQLDGAHAAGGVALSDLTMLVAHGAGERGRSELEALLHAAGFAVTRIIPVGATLHIIEAIPDAQQAGTDDSNR